MEISLSEQEKQIKESEDKQDKKPVNKQDNESDYIGLVISTFC